MTYSVHSKMALESAIIPFFEQHPLLSNKQDDFLKFREVVRAMRVGEHKTRDGFCRIVTLAFSMNQRGKQRKYRLEEILERVFAKPSETARRAPAQSELVKIQSEPCGDAGRAAEMTAPPTASAVGSNKTA